MTDLREWARVNVGPFRFGPDHGPDRPDLRALTDAELVDRARTLRDTLERELEAGAVPVADRERARLLVDRAANI